MTQLKRREVVTAFLSYGGKILLVKRSAKVGSYRGCWSGISGYLEDPTPLEQVLREIREETGLESDDVRLLKMGDPLEARDEGFGVTWVIYPFLFSVTDPEKVRLDWENTELRWIPPETLGEMETVPKLKEALAACLGENLLA